MAGAAATRVLADDAVDLAALRADLAGTGVRVEAAAGPPEGDDVVAVVTWDRAVGEAELARLPALRLLLTPSVGFDHLDLEAARRHGGTWVCHVPDYCVEEMADTAFRVKPRWRLLAGCVSVPGSAKELGRRTQ